MCCYTLLILLKGSLCDRETLPKGSSRNFKVLLRGTAEGCRIDRLSKEDKNKEKMLLRWHDKRVNSLERYGLRAYTANRIKLCFSKRSAVVKR